MSQPSDSTRSGDSEPDPLDEIAAVDLASDAPARLPPLAASIVREMQSGPSRPRSSRPRPRASRLRGTGFRKYKYLDWYIRSCRTTATLILILFILAGISPLILHLAFDAPATSRQAGLLTLVTLPVAGLVGWAVFMAQMAFADFLAAIRDIEENTRARATVADEEVQDAPADWTESWIDSPTPDAASSAPPDELPEPHAPPPQSRPPASRPGPPPAGLNPPSAPVKLQKPPPIRGKPLPGFKGGRRPPAGT